MPKTSKAIAPERVHRLTPESVTAAKGRYVLYWMQQSQRVDHNHALEFAIQQANEQDLPVVVGFGLDPDDPEANARHFTFLLEGLQDVAQALQERRIGFVLRRGSPPEVALALGQEAALIVTDGGYLRHQRQWREQVAREAERPVWVVETDLVVPIKQASDKAEHAARTLRPKLHRQFERFCIGLNPTEPAHDGARLKVPSEWPLDDVPGLVSELGVDASVKPVSALFRGGEDAAKQRFRAFLRESFEPYADHRNRPETSDVSHQSMSLHFGHVSPIWLIRQAREHRRKGGKPYEAFVEELLVRRELSFNFVYHEPHYDSVKCLPGWARETLQEHESDPREQLRTRAQLEAGKTDDRYWNAAMQEMRETGYMHNYMRMYWGKQFIAYSRNASQAYRALLAINNKFFLDGRDANSFANVAWIFGRHDRGWTERPVFGKVRIMKASGLQRKCDPEAYVAKVERLAERVAA
jgi:deoxyribodipyrimidine photo-lyase